LAPVTPATTTLSLHDALPIFQRVVPHCSRIFNHSFFLEDINGCTCCSASYRVSAESCTMAANFPFRHQFLGCYGCTEGQSASYSDRKSTRLNSSHVKISYAVF